MSCVELLINLAAKVFPKFKLQWLATEMRANLPLELNFKHEAENAKRCARNFGAEWGGQVKVPKVYDHLTTKKVLVMEYCDGGKIDDLKFMKENAIEIKQVTLLLKEVFNHMIFKDQFVHCDPHVGKKK